MQTRVRRLRWLRRLVALIAILIVLFIVSCFVFDHFVQFRKTDRELRQYYSENHVPAAIGYYNALGRQLRYAVAGKEGAQGTILFIHGSPGSISYYSRRFSDTDLLKKFRMFAVDRPGYGYSGFGHPEPSIQKQSEMLRLLIDSVYKVPHPVILVGSSYGAPIACRMAMDHPQLVDGLVLTGPAIGPGLEKYFWFTHIVESPLIRWFIPRLFRSANTEKVHHKKELEKMLPLWKTIRVPVVYLQGENDNIVDTSNAGFARTHLVNAPSLDIRFIPGREHRLAQFEWPKFRDAIMEVWNKIESSKQLTQSTQE